jgi:hypothetical protein
VLSVRCRSSLSGNLARSVRFGTVTAMSIFARMPQRTIRRLTVGALLLAVLGALLAPAGWRLAPGPVLPITVEGPPRVGDVSTGSFSALTVTATQVNGFGHLVGLVRGQQFVSDSAVRGPVAPGEAMDDAKSLAAQWVGERVVTDTAALTAGTDGAGGPSAGLALALAYLDHLTPGDLTGGVRYAATGALDDQGRVLPVGGVGLKLVAAASAGFTTVFVPAGSVPAQVPAGISVVEVRSVDEALAWLCAQGATTPLCYD